jgi:nickel-dependent lactate racemase
MKTHFAFGKNGIEVEVPDGFDCRLVRSRAAQALNDAAGAINAALDRPIHSDPLEKLAAGKRTAAIAVCDITRPAPNRITLPPLLQRLHAAGIPKDGITILVATGLHRAATKEELDIILGPEIAATYRTVSHDARDVAAHCFVGTTRRGTPVYVDERFVAADLHITLGFIEPHLMLGFSGGRKLVVPGVAAQETIKAIHAPRFMREPLATEGSIENNPLHQELLEAAALARHDFILDVTFTQQRAISGVFAGHPIKAHAAGVEFMAGTSLTPLDGLVDAVITSSAGYPLDITFYQCVKGLTAAQHIVKPGGKMLLLAECAEGVGSPECARLLKAYRGHAEFLKEIENAPVEIDQWQLEKMALVGLKNELLFYTPGAARETLGSLGSHAFTDVNEAVTALLSGLAPGARVALLPEGPYTFARAMPAYA